MGTRLSPEVPYLAKSIKIVWFTTAPWKLDTGRGKELCKLINMIFNLGSTFCVICIFNGSAIKLLVLWAGIMFAINCFIAVWKYQCLKKFLPIFFQALAVGIGSLDSTIFQIFSQVPGTMLHTVNLRVPQNSAIVVQKSPVARYPTKNDNKFVLSIFT